MLKFINSRKITLDNKVRFKFIGTTEGKITSQLDKSIT